MTALRIMVLLFCSRGGLLTAWAPSSSSVCRAEKMLNSLTESGGHFVLIMSMCTKCQGFQIPCFRNSPLQHPFTSCKMEQVNTVEEKVSELKLKTFWNELKQRNVMSLLIALDWALLSYSNSPKNSKVSILQKIYNPIFVSCIQRGQRVKGKWWQKKVCGFFGGGVIKCKMAPRNELRKA